MSVKSQFTRDEATFLHEGIDILDLIAARTAQTPQVTALICAGDALTYQDLDRKASQLGNYLRGMGVGTEDLIGIYMSRSIEMVIGILGILKSGGAYVPLDPVYPCERLASILDDARVKLIVSQSSLLDTFPDMESKVICLDREWAEIAQQPETIEKNGIPLDNLAYVIYTSGSTGKPKGVMITHANLSNFVRIAHAALPFTSADICLHTASICYALSVRQLMVPLAFGATLVLASAEQARDPILLFGLVKTQHVTLLDVVPSFWRTCIQRLSALPLVERRSLLDNNLRRIVSIGESLSFDIPQRWRTGFGHPAELVNIYGQTETTGIVAAYPIPWEQDSSSGTVPIGRAVPETELYILDPHLQPVPPGTDGELFIGNPCLARGYLNQPELTGEKFVPNPFRKNPGDRLYRTGDLARCQEDGNIEYLGRGDRQVKIRGQRLELGDVEAALCEHAKVMDCAVVVREDVSGDQYLQAYVVLSVTSQGLAAELTSFMRQKVPGYMVPASFVFLKSLPHHPNGKIDRIALGENATQPVISGEEGSSGRPRNEAESKLMQIWQDLLPARPTGIRDNFFDLGGHSLMAVRMFTRIQQEFGVDLPLATLLRKATIEYLAELINGEVKPVTWDSLIAIEPQGNHAPFYCIHGLTGDILWFRELAHLFAPQYPFYGLQSRGLDGIAVPLARVEDMATWYIEEIRRVQPQGPYYLGGASFGGTIALEIAQQLFAQGEEIAMLAIFDHSLSGLKTNPGSRNASHCLLTGYRVLKNFPHWLQSFVQIGPERMFQRARRKLRLVGKAHPHTETHSLNQFAAEDIIDFAGELDANRRQLIQCNFQALKAYLPKPYAGRVTLFRAQNRPLFNPNDPETGWQILAPGRVEVFDIPSSHEGMFKSPHVETLAKKLKMAIEQAEQTRMQ